MKIPQRFLLDVFPRNESLGQLYSSENPQSTIISKYL